MSSNDNIFKVFKSFSEHARYLQHLQKETCEAVENLGKSGNFSEDQLNGMRFCSSELEELNHILHEPPCIVVMGQNTYGKLAIVTRILEKQVIPMIQIQENTLSDFCKPMRFSHSRHFNMKNNIFLSSQKTLDSLTLKDIEFSTNEIQNKLFDNVVIDIEINHQLLRPGVQVLILPSFPDSIFSNEEKILNDKLLLSSVIPIFLYAITKQDFTEEETNYLKNMKAVFPDLPVLFVEVPSLPASFSRDLPESEQHNVLCHMGILPYPFRPNHDSLYEKNLENSKSLHKVEPSYHCISEKLMFALCDILGYLQPEIPPQLLSHRIVDEELQMHSDFVNDIHSFFKIRNYFYCVAHGHLIRASTILQKRHSRCMRMIILYAFDMAREIQITPKRITYSKEKENELFDTLTTITSKKQDEIKMILMESLADIKKNIVNIISSHKFKAAEHSPDISEVSTREIRLCHLEIQELLMLTLSESLGRQLATRFDIMRESYLGTLQRCLENLENDCRVCGESSNIGDALKQMMNAAYQVEVTTSTSFIKSFWNKMKCLMITMPGRTPPVIDLEWKIKVALDIIYNLSESKLTKAICNQFRERLKSSHDSFVICMKQLESQLVGKLEEKEEKHLKIKKVDAPRLARVSLESISLRDRILYGMPELDREIGRGQYGVVYGCKSWGGYAPCAIKSLVPMDDKHWNDLAMEFHYTKSVPDHENIVALRGSVIDYTYAQGDTPAVLLIMDRLNRDLHSGLKSGLDWHTRMQISLDVTKGIRFLHSQGLVHRDIKLKNVLLDSNCRAKLTDLGFCKPEAMMSGSVVGTPIHMAPELFTGHYDNSVDVYAFGILFWYICSGQVKLPKAYEQCHSKDNLWNCVRKGGRPERLPCFSDECWSLMNECWANEPSSRPFLGHVEPKLERIMLEMCQEAKESSGEDLEDQESDYSFLHDYVLLPNS